MLWAFSSEEKENEEIYIPTISNSCSYLSRKRLPEYSQSQTAIPIRSSDHLRGRL